MLAGGAPLRGCLEDRDCAPPHAPVLGRRRRQRQPQRHPLEDQQRDGELQRREEHQQRQQLAERRIRAASRRTGNRTTRSSAVGRHAAQASTANSGTSAQCSADVVIGIADRRRDRDDLAAALGFGRGDCSGNLLAVASVSCITSCLPLRRRRTSRRRSRRSRRRRRRRRPRTNRRPSRLPPEPRSSAFRPHSTTHGLMPPPRVR